MNAECEIAVPVPRTARCELLVVERDPWAVSGWVAINGSRDVELVLHGTPVAMRGLGALLFCAGKRAEDPAGLPIGVR